MRLPSRCHVSTLIAVLLAAVVGSAQEKKPSKLGVFKTSDGVCPGYILISPLSTEKSFLLDTSGKVVNSWQSDRKPGQASYLLEDGSLLRAGKVDNFFQFPSTTGSGGQIQNYDWDGNLTWDFTASSAYRMSHHDIEPMPNGNVLCIVWESYRRDVAVKAGRNPDRLTGDVLWLEAIFELKPKGLNGADIVWKWSLLDHLIQDWDKSKDNHGDPAEHPELVDVNCMLRSAADWVHMNSIDYNEELDQIMVGSRTLSEFWIIDHSTTTEEAKGHTGGKRGHGGDLLYRWGNPQNYRQGTDDDRTLFNQHDAHWIPKGLPGAGNVLLFNNGLANSEQDFSSADEIKLPLGNDGTYLRKPQTAFGPAEVEWTYEHPGELFSPRISGAQRLPNGNTLICSGTQYLLLEVTSNAEIVWMYRNPRRFRNPPRSEGNRKKSAKPAPADLPQAELDAMRIPGGVPLEDGGTMFRAIKYPPDYPAFRDRDLSPKL
ncbi:MAG: aryl-sulfate sulfotransferase [Fuerstiella sp.]